MKELTYDLVIENLKNKVNFSYARYGDGELNVILGKIGANCDGHEYFPDMGQHLKTIVHSQPDYYIGLQNLGKRQNEDKPEFQEFFQKNTWSDNEIFTRASIKNNLKPFVEALKTRSVIQVGPKNLRQLNLSNHFIEIPEKNCWLDRERIIEELEEHIHHDCVIIYSASMMTKYIIDKMYTKYGEHITQIDTGSVWDVYTGKASRTYMKEIQSKGNDKL